jgi:dihydroorotate dehydrogenase electron transfer subunit
MPMQKICTLLTSEELAPGIVSQVLDAGELADGAKPGQFVNLSCGDGLLLRRPISICEAGEGKLRIVYQVKGEGTRYLAALQPGAAVDVLGPLGHGWEYPESGKVLVVGGGIGVPPMLYAAQAAPNGAVAAVGFRTAALQILGEDFAKIGCPVRVASDDGTVGYHGFVNELVKRELAADPSITCVMACGPRPMLKSVYLAAEEYHIPCQVSMEERMGCGVGACLVCACSVGGHNKHVCKDGPVFKGEEVDW